MTLTERIRLATKLGYLDECDGLRDARDGQPRDPTALERAYLQGYQEGKAILEIGEGR